MCFLHRYLVQLQCKSLCFWFPSKPAMYSKQLPEDNNLKGVTIFIVSIGITGTLFYWDEQLKFWRDKNIPNYFILGTTVCHIGSSKGCSISLLWSIWYLEVFFYSSTKQPKVEFKSQSIVSLCDYFSLLVLLATMMQGSSI